MPFGAGAQPLHQRFAFAFSILPGEMRNHLPREGRRRTKEIRRQPPPGGLCCERVRVAGGPTERRLDELPGGCVVPIQQSRQVLRVRVRNDVNEAIAHAAVDPCVDRLGKHSRHSILDRFGLAAKQPPPFDLANVGAWEEIEEGRQRPVLVQFLQNENVHQHGRWDRIGTRGLHVQRKERIEGRRDVSRDASIRREPPDDRAR